jgi:uncharacterized protein (DUF779 family)
MKAKVSISKFPTLSISTITLGIAFTACAADTGAEIESFDSELRSCQKDLVVTSRTGITPKDYVRRCKKGKLGTKVHFTCTGSLLDGTQNQCFPSDGLGLPCSHDSVVQSSSRTRVVRHCNHVTGKLDPAVPITECTGGTNDGSASMCWDANGVLVNDEDPKQPDADQPLPGGG